MVEGTKGSIRYVKVLGMKLKTWCILPSNCFGLNLLNIDAI